MTTLVRLSKKLYFFVCPLSIPTNSITDPKKLQEVYPQARGFAPREILPFLCPKFSYIL